MKKILHKFSYYFGATIDHIYSRWYKCFLGSTGHGTVIRRHCTLDGDCLPNVSMGNYCYFDSFCVIEAFSHLAPDGTVIKPTIKLGEHCSIGQYTHITAVNKINIGDNLLTGRFVLISDNCHGNMKMSEQRIHPSRRPVVSKGDIIIGNNVWLADKVTILPGVHIGDGSVIGANSVVTHDIPSFCVAAGNPAKVIKFFK